MKHKGNEARSTVEVGREEANIHVVFGAHLLIDWQVEQMSMKSQIKHDLLPDSG